MSLEKCCVKALNQTAVDGFHDILEDIVVEFDITALCSTKVIS
jgi:hypothetical protein